MLMDPFRPGGMGSMGGQGFGPPPHPGQLPRFVTSGDLLIISKFILTYVQRYDWVNNHYRYNYCTGNDYV